MQNLRLQRLLDDVKARRGSFYSDHNILSRDLAWHRAAGVPERSLSQLRANTVLELARFTPCRVSGEWTLAGEHLLEQRAQWWGPVWGSLNGNFSDDERRAALKLLAPEVSLEQVKSALPQVNSCVTAGEATPGGSAGRCGWCDNDSDGVYMSVGWVENHSVRDYAKLLRLGYGGLKAEIAAELKRYPLHSVDYARRENFLRAAMAICDAGIALGRRYALAASEAARGTSDPAAKARLEAMAAACRRVPEHGATTLAEAVQALWFGHIITCAEDGINANSLGRLDQIFQPYYQSDLAAGRITREQAVEVQTELAVKLYLEYDVQAIVLGGVDAEGLCAVCDMSYILLDATREFGEIRDLSVRIDSRTPEAFLEACAELVVKGGGIPFFFNDECFIPALAERGIALEDARNYAPIGCIELTVPGRANPHAVSGWFNLLKVLELTLHNGRNPVTGQQLGPETGELAEFANYAELEAAFARQVEFFASRMIYFCRRGEIMQRAGGALPGWSLLTDGCIERGRDITDSGAIYNYHEICCMGVPDTADALAALKLLLFEERALTPAELLAALADNFAGHGNIRSMLLKRAPKYGNGDAAVDAIAAKLCRDFIALMDAWSEPGNRLYVHLFTFLLNIDFGKKVGALPDGRLAGEPLAYSLSAHQGRDLEGVTALLNSLARMPHREAGGASAAIIDLHPSVLTGDAAGLFVQLLRGAIAAGVGQMQWNVLSAEALERAKADPERYGNIPVRVAGYSQLFKLVPPELQEHIIARHKHRAL